MHGASNKRNIPFDKTDKQFLVARFVVRGNDDIVYFVKTKGPSTSRLFCTCDGFAANAVSGLYKCRHTQFCFDNVLDIDGWIPIDDIPPQRISKDKKTMPFWLDRHVKTFEID